jgi:hypothetical protein
MPMVNRPVPALKAGWPSTSALREFDRVTFAMLFAVTHNQGPKELGPAL